MRRLLPIAAVAALVWAPGSHAAGPVVTVAATPASGGAPLTVVLTASGDPATYSWNLGDGTTATGPVVQHVYQQAGRYHAIVTATAGSDSSTAEVTVTAYALSLHGPATAQFGGRALFKGRIAPATAALTVALVRDGRTVGTARTGPGGRYRIRPKVTTPGSYVAVSRNAGVQSSPLALRIQPLLLTKVRGSGVVHTPLAVVARVRPATAGRLRIRVYRGSRRIRQVVLASPARIPLRTGAPQEYRVRVQVVAAQGYTHPATTVRVGVFFPNLSLGSRGPSVSVLQSRLRAQHYMLLGVTGRYGMDTYDAVLAFEKVHWLPRTGSVDNRVWRVLVHSATPRPRFTSPGLHYEVDKTRQVLLDVLNGQVIRIVHVSTGATGNTPVGVFHTYYKTSGFNQKGMYDSQYFIAGFAIHGYAQVPPYPASHGCVRTPLWVAPILFATHPLGTAVYVYGG